MFMAYPSLKDAAIAGKRVLLRAGFDLPIKNGEVQDVTRIEAMLPTIKYVVDSGAALIIIAHQGRPDPEKREPEFSQKPVAAALERLLGSDVTFIEGSCVSDEAKQAAQSLESGRVLLLENLRYEKGEKSKDAAERDVLGKELASLADIYVNDAFTNCHRDHASMTSVPKFLPSFMGIQLEREVEHLSKVTDDPKHPLTLIISGAKMETKVPVIEHFLDKGDDVLVGGCIANTLMAARGFDMAESKYEEDFVEVAQNIMLESEKEENATVHVPRDVVVADEVSADASALDLPLEDIEGDMKVLDIGSVTANRYCEIIAASKMIVWNGPLGVYEYEQFAGASKRVAVALQDVAKAGAEVIIGGGDTLDFHHKYDLSMDDYTFVSTGGGAMLEFITGKKLPALEALSA